MAKHLVMEQSDTRDAKGPFDAQVSKNRGLEIK
jgi:hypothetical protein